jgi:mannose-6-phosphate isomerase
LKPGVGQKQLEEAARGGRVESCIRHRPIRPGDFIQIPAGTVHSILAGTLLCEVQQSSNLTWRLWDWNREPRRELHIEQACRAARQAKSPEFINARETTAEYWHVLVRNDYFEVQTIYWPADGRVFVEYPNPHGVALCVLEGHGRLRAAGQTHELRLGQTWLLPAGLETWHVEIDKDGLRLLASSSLEL